MIVNDEQVWEQVELGRQTIADAERLKLEREEKIAREAEEKKQAAMDEFQGYLGEAFPWVVKYAAIEAAFENLQYNERNISLRVEIPGFAPMIMAFQRKPLYQFEGVKWAMMRLYRPDEDELGFETWEEVFPQFSFKYQEHIMDVPVALARAKEQGELMEAALARWEVVKAELIADHQRKMVEEEAKTRGEHAAEKDEYKPSCSMPERIFLDALVGYLNWLDEEVE